MATPLSPSCTSSSAMKRLSTRRNSMPRNSIMSISIRPMVSRSSRLCTSDFWFMVEKECPVEQVDPDDANCLLLERCIDVEHSNMKDDLAGLVARMGLELQSHPPMALVVPFEAAGDNGIGEGKKRCRVAPFVCQSFDVQLVLMIEHCLKATGGDVSIDFSVNSVAHRHVVGGDGFCDCSRRQPRLGRTSEPPPVPPRSRPRCRTSVDPS